MPITTNAEKKRLAQVPADKRGWKFFGPYLSERQWGTVREDYSPGGDAWEYLTHDQARSRAYRWGEDGIAGISDLHCRICLSLALWNGKDPIIKERLFGLTNPEGNHGEDVKELYYYLDATPSHSYLKMLYKYPQDGFPYDQLARENRRRGREEPEFELLDTGIFDEDRYFDVFIEYAQAAPEDLLMRVTVHNRGPREAELFLMPQLWFRNTWAWNPDSPRPQLSLSDEKALAVEHSELGNYTLYAAGKPEIVFCGNDSNLRLYGQESPPGYFKDGLNDYLVNADPAAVNPQKTGTKAGLIHHLTLPAGGSDQIRLRLTKAAKPAPFSGFDATFTRRIKEADEFYAGLQRQISDPDARLVQRQAWAGLIWSKQFYYYDVPQWLNGDPGLPDPPDGRKQGRNHEWLHLNNADIISMPDKWEYPWYAAWDLAFHCIGLARLDPEFAKAQLVLLAREWYMHPNGQFPACEWDLGNVNPPVHAWAAWRVYQIDREERRKSDAAYPGDRAFLERIFHKLMLNFTWWVNRKDAQGRSLFQGGFLGLDNIGIFDRSAPLPTGGFINQSDGTAWMAMYSLNLMRIALELARAEWVYEDIATKFFEHFLQIVEAMNNLGGSGLGMWNEEDEFFYDVLNLPGGDSLPLRIRSMVGLIPLFAVEVLESEHLKQLPAFAGRLEWFLNYRPDLAKLVSRWQESGSGERHLLSLLRGHRMKCVLRRMLDETEFLGSYGVRALSKVHEDQPYGLELGGEVHEVRYWPAESQSGLFGGNSNWRGPIWMPVNFLIIESLRKFQLYYGDDFKIECPTGSGRYLTLEETADELSRRLSALFLAGQDGARPVLKYHPKLAEDPNFKDYVLFHEYFHGDSGRGAGASHQTGWTALVSELIW